MIKTGEEGVVHGNTCILTFPLWDYDEVTPVRRSQISTALMTIKNADTDEVIADAEDIDVINDITENGVWSRVITNAQNALVNTDLQPSDDDDVYELHYALITITATNGSSQDIVFRRKFEIRVMPE